MKRKNWKKLTASINVAGVVALVIGIAANHDTMRWIGVGIVGLAILAWIWE